MNLFLLFSFLTNIIKNPKTNIIPDCKDCIFYNKGITKDSPNLCRKYGEKEDLTGRIIFYDVNKCRSDIFRCGEHGKYFIKK